MGKKPDGARRLIAPLVAVLLVGILYLLSRQPTLSREEADELASRFRFERLPLPELAGRPLDRTVRQVHPSLRHLSAFVSFSGAAVALADLDGDGLPNDLIYVDPRGDQVIVAPVPGTTERYAPFALDAAPLPFDPSTMAPTGCLAGDFNEDGLTDVLVCYWGRSPVLFLQRPEPAAGASPLARDRFVPCELADPYQVWYTSAVTQADLDGDGHIDLIVGNYFRDGARILDAAAPGTEQMPHSASRAFNGGRNRLFLWEGAGGGAKPSARFREAEGVLDDEVACGWTLAVGAADLDGDLLPEIYFVQDFGPDRLLHNRSRPGQPRFALLQGERTMTTPRSKVLGRDSFNGMGIDFGDLNGDGWPDIFVSNITGPFGLHESHFLFLSTGQVDRMQAGVAPYRDASEELGLSRSGWAWEARLADFDNDGVLEAMQAAVAMLLYYNDRLWVVAFATAVAIGSKTVFRAPAAGGTRHFFNPSNFAISVTLLVFPWVGLAIPWQFTEATDGIGDWLVPVVILCAGTFLNARYNKRLPLVAAFLGGFVLQALVRHLAFQASLLPMLAPATGVAAVIFTFFMLPDPATTPAGPRAQLLFGLAVAAVYLVLVCLHVVFGLFFALTLVCAARGLWLYGAALVPSQPAAQTECGSQLSV